MLLTLSLNDCPTLGVFFCPKMVVRDQMFINFVDVKKFATQYGMPKQFLYQQYQ